MQNQRSRSSRQTRLSAVGSGAQSTLQMGSPHCIRRSMQVAAMAALAVVAVGSTRAADAAANEATSPQGRSWDSIKHLPDWSGVWALNLQGHLFAGAESKGTDNGAVPLTPKYFQLRAATRAARAQENLSNCLPAGVPGIMLHTIQLEFLFAPGRVTLITENGEVRRIYTDGRPHLSLEEIGASYEGDSIGHWEGKTLVVDTIGFPKGSLFQNYGILATKHTHYAERIFKKDKDDIEIDSVIDDPEIFTRPYAAARIYSRLNLPMQEPACSQTNRDDGKTVDLTPPEE